MPCIRGKESICACLYFTTYNRIMRKSQYEDYMTFETGWRSKARAAGWDDAKIDAVTARLQEYAGEEIDAERVARYLWDAEQVVCAVAEYAAEYDREKT